MAIGCGRLALAVTAGLLSATLLRAQENLVDQLVFEPVVHNVFRAVQVTHAGDGSGRLFIVVQQGRIRVFDDERVLEEPFLDLTSQVSCCSEQGLLSVAFHPEFESNGYFFVDYTDVDGDTVVSRFRVSEDPNVADPTSEEVLLSVPQPSSSHNGGQLQFGPDGLLYIGVGDGGANGGEAQSLYSLYGAILRVDVNQGNGYSIPATNPFAAVPNARGEIWVWGLRNPWRFSFDRRTGDMYIGDVGWDSREEIDLVPGTSPGGENFGWNILEGNLCLADHYICGNPSLVPPILDHSHLDQACSGSVIGGYRYRGLSYPQLDGVYFYADYCTGRFYAAVETENGWENVGVRSTGQSISSFGEDEAGELYFTDHGDGVTYRITADVPPPSLSRLSPTLAVAGGADLVLTLAGSNFVPTSQVHWNGEPRPTTFLDSRRLQVAISSDDIATAVTAPINVRSPSPGGGLSEALDFEVLAEPILSTAINDGGVVEAAASNPAAGVAAGSIASVYGADLAVRTELAFVDPLPTTLGGAALRFNEMLVVPLFYSDPRQQNIQIPWELAGLDEATLTSLIGNQVSAPTNVLLSTFSPGLFSMDGTGMGQGAILIVGQGLTIAAPEGVAKGSGSRAARPGEFLAVFANGLGPVSHTPPTGVATPVSPLSVTTTQPTVTIGGVEAPVSFSGLSPGSVALYQVNVEVTEGVPSGDAVPVELTIAEKRSNTVTVAIAAE